MSDFLNLCSIDSVYKDLVKNMPYCYSFNKIVLDVNNQPIDFIFIDINNSFLKLVDMKLDKLLCRRYTEVLCNSNINDLQLIQIVGQVALSKKQNTIEYYSEALNKWLSIYIYSNKSEYFSVIVRDLS